MTSLLQRKRKSVQPSRFWNRQNLLHTCTKIREHNRGFVLYFSNWLARNWSTQAHDVKTTCAEQFWTLFGTKNFVLCCFPSLTVQEVQISREHVDGEKRWVISLKGVALVQWSQCTWFLVMMRVFFEGSVENLAATWPDVLFIVHTIDSAFTTGRIWSYMLFHFRCNNDAVIMCSRCTYTISIWQCPDERTVG